MYLQPQLLQKQVVKLEYEWDILSDSVMCNDRYMSRYLI